LKLLIFKNKRRRNKIDEEVNSEVMKLNLSLKKDEFEKRMRTKLILNLSKLDLKNDLKKMPFFVS